MAKRFKSKVNGTTMVDIRLMDKKIVKDTKGRFTKGTITNPKIVNKFEDNKLFQHELNEIKLIESATNLTFIERGKKYDEFKTKYELSDTLVGEYFGKTRSTISRDIRLYKRANEYNIETKDATDRDLMMALDCTTKEKAQRFMIDRKLYNLDSELLIKLSKGTITVGMLKEQLTTEYNNKIKELERWERDHKFEAKEQEYTVEGDSFVEE